MVGVLTKPPNANFGIFIWFNAAKNLGP